MWVGVCVCVCVCGCVCVWKTIDAHPFETSVSNSQGIMKKILKQEDD